MYRTGTWRQEEEEGGHAVKHGGTARHEDRMTEGQSKASGENDSGTQIKRHEGRQATERAQDTEAEGRKDGR